MKPRHLLPRVLAALTDTPVVFVQGPRQSGKTTLVRSITIRGAAIDYRTLDDAATLASAQHDPDSFVATRARRVILDEVQRAPDLFRAIKRSVDRDRIPGRFLLTGSASALLLPTMSDSLAGRMEVITLRPFSQGELGDVRESFIDACFAHRFRPVDSMESSWASLAARIVRGGFPDAVSRRDPARRTAWFDSYITTILERDVRDLANVASLHDLPRLLRLLAARASAVLNLSDVARDAQIPLTTLQRYWALLHAVFFVSTLPTWSGNLTSRIAKAPKLLFGDTGLLCHLLALDEKRLKSDAMMTGAVLETFVASELQKQAAWSRARVQLHSYRTPKQQEVDIVLEDARGRIVGIEVKKSASPGSHDFTGLRHLRDAAGPRFLRGILLYTGDRSVSFGPGMFAVPVGALWSA
ncbi:MAG: ATP-binding protein [Ignavibacteria bacterium]|nr:ATP-binding protein [Ignavibacteria bacterium]